MLLAKFQYKISIYLITINALKDQQGDKTMKQIQICTMYK